MKLKATLEHRLMSEDYQRVESITIENGDTLEDPQILENGQVRKFDRVLANPPFSQNFSRPRRFATVITAPSAETTR